MMILCQLRTIQVLGRLCGCSLNYNWITEHFKDDTTDQILLATCNTTNGYLQIKTLKNDMINNDERSIDKKIVSHLH